MSTSGTAVASPLQGTVVSIDVAAGDHVHAGQQVAVIESMKMEHVVTAERAGVVTRIELGAGEQVKPGTVLVVIDESAAPAAAAAPSPATGDEAESEAPGAERRDLADVLERHAMGLDERRPDAVARRRRTGQRTARENVDDL